MFERNVTYDSQFDAVENLKWYPYVGPQYDISDMKIMVLAHNIPIDEKRYDEMKIKWSPKDYWAIGIEEYTYEKGFWTESFRSFIKGAVGLKENYDEDSDNEIIEKVNAFVNSISYVNYIQDIVKSNSQMINASKEQIEESIPINEAIFRILGITHCICWGKQVYNHIKSSSNVINFTNEINHKEGFAECGIMLNDQPIKLLKVFHPSMPKFGKYSESTHEIIANFLNR